MTAAAAIELWAARRLLRLPRSAQLFLSRRAPVVVDGQALHPEMQLLLAIRTLRGGRSLSAGGVADARARLLEETTRFAGPPAPVRRSSDLSVFGADGPLPARHYEPQLDDTRPAPLLVFFHGGGFVSGDLDTHDRTCRLICCEAAVHVLSVAYRLAPEHPFPTAVDDACAAFRWAFAHAAELGADGARVGVGGDSAGGNLAAVVSQIASDARPAVQLLIYPPVDRTVDRPSMSLFATGFLLTAGDVRWYDRLYLGEEQAVRADPRASPLNASRLDGLPPAVVAVAGFDPLRDEANAYAAALNAAGVPTTYLGFPGLVHGFVNMIGVSPVAHAAVTDIARALRAAFEAVSTYQKLESA
jgi:acetyl esterase